VTTKAKPKPEPDALHAILAGLEAARGGPAQVRFALIEQALAEIAAQLQAKAAR
jgi:hypothetical protein